MYSTAHFLSITANALQHLRKNDPNKYAVCVNIMAAKPIVEEIKRRTLGDIGFTKAGTEWLELILMLEFTTWNNDPTLLFVLGEF